MGSKDRDREYQGEERGDGQARYDEGKGTRLDEGLRQKLEGLIPEIVRRTFYAGVGAVFTTEEGIRKLAADFSLPKDMANFLIQQAQSTKNELFRIVASELREFLESLNLSEELQRLLTSLSFEIKTEIRFIPNDAQRPRARVKNTVSVKQRERAADDNPAEATGAESGESTEPINSDEPL